MEGGWSVVRSSLVDRSRSWLHSAVEIVDGCTGCRRRIDWYCWVAAVGRSGSKGSCRRAGTVRVVVSVLVLVGLHLVQQEKADGQHYLEIQAVVDCHIADLEVHWEKTVCDSLEAGSRLEQLARVLRGYMVSKVRPRPAAGGL